MSIRRRALLFALSAASVALVLLLAELGLRLVHARDPVPGLKTLHELTPDEPQLFALAPGARSVLEEGGIVYQVNADGMRDRRYARERTPGVRRIAIVGDSVTFGIGVRADEVYSEQLEAALGEGSEVLNFGVGGYNAYNERGLLESRVLAYRPDLVLVQFCINDLNDPTLHFDTQTRMALGTIPDEAYPNLVWKQERARSQAPVSWLAGCNLRLCGLLPYGLVASHDAGDRSQYLTQVSLARLSRGAISAWLRRQYDAMSAASLAAGARFAVIAMPHQEQLHQPGLREIQSDLVALGERAGWPVLDPLPAFLAAARETGAPPLFLDIWHLSAAGHAVVASELERALPALLAEP
jgi:lysophospholipase L1-like esterase